MLKLSNCLFIFLFLGNLSGFAQQCTILITGKTIDESTKSNLEFATLYLEGKEVYSVLADSSGKFQIPNVCSGEYHLRISHIACETEKIYLNITQDTSITIPLHHHNELMNELIVHGSSEAKNSNINSTLSKETLEENAEKSLSEIVESISGVSSLKSGSGISKPIIHGLYGNRVGIYNNGVEQAGQFWGSDHAPEIDPFSANHVSVIKGSGSLAFMGSNLGGMVLVEPSHINEDPHLHAQINSIFSTNGRATTLNTQLEKNNLNNFGWRFSGTYNTRGDLHTPNYFLTNTGKNEYNGSLQLEKKWSRKSSSTLFLSTFNNQTGILKGSHISNLTDLENALNADVPFFTEENFSRDIDSPKQKVNHNYLKLEHKYTINSKSILNFAYAFQNNNRKEYDVRRSGRSIIPALSLTLNNHFIDFNLTKNLNNNGLIKTGIQYSYFNNTNDPDTGILPLIPDYLKNQTGAFFIYNKEIKKLSFDIGARADYQYYNVQTISTTLPREIIPYTNTFSTGTVSTGLNYDLSQTIKFNFNMAYAYRPPAINELYSNGLHQGVSGIERGNLNLNPEKSFKTVAELDFNLKNKAFFKILGYYQNINNFIYLKPELTYEITIRGAFPIYNYSQTDATLLGADFQTTINLLKALKINYKASILKGRNLKTDSTLINMPSNNWQLDLVYAFNTKVKTELSYSLNYVAQQNSDVIDYVLPPSEYYLSNLNFKTGFFFKEKLVKATFKVENMFNTVYRDYLNKQRYFADDLGRNFVLGLNLNF